MSKYSESHIKEKLKEVIDPELDISIVDLGLVYQVEFPDEKNIKIIMTLTSMGCPLFSTIHSDIYKALESLGYTPDTIEVELTWDPPWNESMMSDEAKAEIGII